MKFLSFLLPALIWAIAGTAEPLKLTLANPQPAALSSGLAVSYANGSVRSLRQAARLAKNAKPGIPLEGLDYWDTKEGEETLTSGQAKNVIAKITGYVRFEQPGIYTIDFLSNDGLQMSIGGQEVVFFDGVHSCDESDAVEAEVPKAGWYALEGLYFQRKGSACLHMRAGIGAADWMPNSAFGH